MSKKQHHFSVGRTENLKAVFELIKEHGPIKQSKILALIDLYQGKTEKTALTYLRTLQNTDMIKWDGKKEVWQVA